MRRARRRWTIASLLHRLGRRVGLPRQWKKRFARIESGEKISLSVPTLHLQWVFGVGSPRRSFKTRRLQARRRDPEDDVSLSARAR